MYSWLTQCVRRLKLLGTSLCDLRLPSLSRKIKTFSCESMESGAQAYSAHSKPQFDKGCDFVRLLNIREGDRVLDMGCGTGELTNFIASVVGPKGEVLGVDPDGERIKIAQETFRDVKNLHFFVGDSSSKLPYDDQEYYNLYFSNSVFNWLAGDEKQAYFKKAYQCLKPAGRLASRYGLFLETAPKTICQVLQMEFLTVAEHKQLCEDHSFHVILAERRPFFRCFSSFEAVDTWLKASLHHDLMELDENWTRSFFKQRIKTEADGSVIIETNMFDLIAEKV